MTRNAQVPVTVYFRIIEILLLVMVIVIVATEVNTARKSGVFQREFLRHDLPLLLTSLTNARGNVLYAYGVPSATLSRFTFDFSNGVVSVDGESWPYAVNQNFNYVTPKLEKPNGLVVKKEGNRLSIQVVDARTVQFNGLAMECAQNPLTLSRVIIDAGDGVAAGSDGKPAEPELALRIAGAFAANLKLSRDAILFTHPLTGARQVTVKDRSAFITDHPDAVIISLRTGKTAPGNVIKAVVSTDAPPEANQLACQVLNALADAYPGSITGTALVPVDLSQLGEHDPKQVLAGKRIAFLLELGNSDLSGNPLFADVLKLGEVLARGVQQ